MSGDEKCRVKEILDMAQGVWIVAEQKDGEIRKVTHEVVSEGRRLADELGQEVTVLLLGSNIKDKAAELGYYGADKVLVADDSRLETYTTDAYVSVISESVKTNEPAYCYWERLLRERISLQGYRGG